MTRTSLVLVAGLLFATPAHSQVCGPGEVHVNNSPGANIDGVVIQDGGEYCVTAQGARRITPTTQQARTPRLDDVMTPAARALIVEAMEKAGSHLARAYAQGAPLRWTHVADVERALEALGTPEAAALAAQIEAARPPANRTEVEPSGPSPKKLTFEDGHRVGWGEQHGPQFLHAWSEDDVATVRRALGRLEEEHLKNPQGIDNFLMGRQARILEKLEKPGFFMYGMYLDIDLVGWQYPHARSHHRGWPVEVSWRLQPMTAPETTLTGFAVSRDDCRPEDQDVDELQFLEAGVECYIRNIAAIKLFGRIEKSRHMTSGGSRR